MGEKSIFGLVKFCKEESHADQFLDGKLYMNRLCYFRKIEGEADDGRGDANEGVAIWWQPDHIEEMTLRIGDLEQVKITKHDLAAPIASWFETQNRLPLFCMHAMYTPDLEQLYGSASLSDIEAEADRQVRIDERCFCFGDYAVFAHAKPFMERIRDEFARQRIAFTARQVHYYDAETFSGEFEPRDAPFWKQRRFEYQREFRICVRTDCVGDGPVTFNIGDIRAIAVKGPADQFRNVKFTIRSDT